MRRLLLPLSAVLLAGVARPADKPAAPFADETLRYSINWPSGLSLGEAQLIAKRGAERWNFAMSLDAAVPGFIVSDSYQSTASGDFCSEEFVKTFTHGSRKAGEKTTFDLKKGTATRQTLAKDAGKSELAAPGCPRDALDFLYYLRRELGQGRIPPAQSIFFGAAYQIKIEYGGQQNIRVNDKKTDAELYKTTMKGPASEAAFEVYFARDAARTPLLFRVPLPKGAFTMELVR